MRLRAHHLLCLLGFRGLGYSKRYVDNMWDIVERLASSPQVLLTVVAEPDDICAPCPFLGEAGCRQEGPDTEEKLRRRDLVVMAKLGLAEGAQLPWAALASRMAAFINIVELNSICCDCQWLPQGYCADGLEALRESRWPIASRDKG